MSIGRGIVELTGACSRSQPLHHDPGELGPDPVRWWINGLVLRVWRGTAPAVLFNSGEAA